MSEVNKLLQTIANRGVELILTHNNPDPDAIASTTALVYLLSQKLQITSSVFYHGLIGRAENQALVRYLAENFPVATSLPSTGYFNVVLVDVQPHSSMLTQPAGANVVAVIDRHSIQRKIAAEFIDIRPTLGATSTILTRYLQEAGIEPPAPLATALFYGIKTNTMSLGRGASPVDATAYFYLQSRVDVEALGEIENVQLPAIYFKHFARALESTRIYSTTILTYMGRIRHPDLTAEMAEFLLRFKRAKIVICAGAYGDKLHFSIRSRSLKAPADELALTLAAPVGTAGGRGEAAGGVIRLDNSKPEALFEQIRQKTLHFLALPADLPGEPLV